ncbi:hypothetical protein EVAR_85855_1 [Eumeta japonica]|uniref:Mos1 transposase HTH domain-containing protein n=1 Tax=Eumeta variegata TaxID=151549 RepID=A0A4C1URQ4_EUMVA|nr:hypothetical protein EVAR_85855_1 [Eumeta japonica]
MTIVTGRIIRRLRYLSRKRCAEPAPVRPFLSSSLTARLYRYRIPAAIVKAIKSTDRADDMIGAGVACAPPINPIGFSTKRLSNKLVLSVRDPPLSNYRRDFYQLINRERHSWRFRDSFGTDKFIGRKPSFDNGAVWRVAEKKIDKNDVVSLKNGYATRERFRATIFNDFERRPTPKESFESLRTASQEKGFSKATVYRWFYESRRGRVTLADEKSGSVFTAATEGNVLAV